jgi:hypothetical protein
MQRCSVNWALADAHDALGNYYYMLAGYEAGPNNWLDLAFDQWVTAENFRNQPCLP